MHKFPLILLVVTFLLIQKQERVVSYEIELKDAKSEFGQEDLNGRLAYEQMLIVNPKTGTVPPNIRRRELLFARQIDLKSDRGRTQALDVSSAGPFNVGGRTRAIALDVRDENVILAGGVSGGIWKSLDAGLTWTRKSDPENRNSVTCLVQDTRPGKEDTWYHGTGELVGNSARGGAAPFRGNGIYKSLDNGETWNPLSSTLDSDPSVFNSQFQYIWNMAINENNLVDDEVLVAAFGGLLRSLDGGDTWTVELGRKLFDLDPSVNLNEVPASFFTDLGKTANGVFYATFSLFSAAEGISPDAGIYVSEDAENWDRIDGLSNVINYQRIVIGASPSTPDQCYFLVDSSPAQIFRYDLQGFDEDEAIGTLTNLSQNLPEFPGSLGSFDSQGSFNMLIRVHPTDPNIVFIGGTNLYRSTDGFTSSENTDWIGGYDPEGGSGVYLNHHPDQHNLVFFPSNPDRMISANDGGLRLTADVTADSVTWESRNNGYLTSQFYSVALAKDANDDFLLGGMQDNGTDISSGSESWQGVIGGDGGYVGATPNRTMWFASFQNGQSFRLILDEELKLEAFARIDPSGLVADAASSYLFINPFIVDPSNPNRMFIAGGNQLYVNDNTSQIPGGSQKGATIGWEIVPASKIDLGSISALEISLDGQTVYFGSSGGELFKIDYSLDDFASAGSITSPEFPQRSFISSVSANVDNPEHLVVTFSNYGIPSVFESTNGGASFEDISGNLEQFPDGTGNGPSIRWSEVIPTNTGLLYLLGTSTGLYSTTLTDGAATVWSRESSEKIGSSVVTMMDYRPIDGRLAIATHGNGVFTTTVNDFKQLEVPRVGEPFESSIAFPNPFETTTKIRYAIPTDATVKIDLYSSKGNFVKNLFWAPQFAGENSITWDGTNTSGTTVDNGVYLYRIEYEGTATTGRVVLRR